MVSRSMISRSGIAPSSTCLRHAIRARMVSGLSYRPPIIISRPASIRFAIAISPSRDSNSTVPISRKYIRTGSSEPDTSESDRLPEVVPSSFDSSALASSLSAESTTFTPISLKADMTSSICSDDNSSWGRAAFNSSCVTKPRSLPFLIRVLIAEFFVSRIGASPFWSFASAVFALDLRAIILVFRLLCHRHISANDGAFCRGFFPHSQRLSRANNSSSNVPTF